MSLVTGEEFRAAMGSFASGVAVITAVDRAGTPHGLTATAFSSVCVEPPTCLVCICRSGRAHRAIEETGMFAVNMLAAGAEDLSSRFASRAADKFQGVSWQPGKAHGCPTLERAVAFVECTVAGRCDAGDHDVFFGRVSSAVVRAGRPLLYFRGKYGHLADAEHTRMAGVREGPVAKSSLET